MKVYEIKRKVDAPNVFGISLVGTPAMESNYVKMSKENTTKLSEVEKIELSNQNDLQLKVQDKEKRLLMGLVLEPNKLIYRYDQQTKEEYYITVNEETIVELAHDFIKNANQSYSTIEHDGKELDGVTFVENWIVEDSNIDKSALYGLSYKKGSWVTVAKIDNEALWNDYVKNGVVQGFSIDAMVSLEEVNLNKQDEQMKEEKTVIEMLKDLPNQIKLALTPTKEVEEVKEKEVELSEEVPEAVVEVAPIEVKEEFNLDAFKQAMSELGVEFASVVKEALEPLKSENVELSKTIESLENKVVELEKQDASNAIVSVPKQLDFSKMTNFEKLKYNRENL